MREKRSNSKSPTMKDVARLAGVSQPTVSRVLNNTPTPVPVSSQTREKVLAAVKELGYQPNRTARSLRTQRTQMIAVMIADISNSFYHPIARAVQDIARQHDYDVLISSSDHNYENEKHFFEAVVRRPVDGVIMVPIHLTQDDIDRFIALTNTPVVVLGQHVDHPDVDVISVNDYVATFEAVTWLINERGYESVGFLGVPDNYPPGPRRWEGFRKAMQQAELPIEPRFVLRGDFSMESGRCAAQTLAQQHDWPQVVFALNDLMAIGMILELQEQGFVVPDDIAIMGFDDIPEATLIRPTLTTIAQDSVDIGRKLAETLFDRIEGQLPDSRRSLESRWTIIKRQSA